jgi:two-component system response regulator YesN
MPGLTGMELIKELFEIGYKGKIIILSGYGEFDYAREAIKWGIRSYLLKPIDTEELLDVLIEIDSEIREEQQQHQLITNSRTILRNKTLHKLMVSGINQIDELNSILTSSSLENLLTGNRFCVCIVSYDDYALVSSEEGSSTADDAKASIVNILVQEIESVNQGYVIELENALIGILLVQRHNTGISMREIIQATSKTVQSKIQYSCSMALGSQQQDISQIHRSFLNALKVMNYKLAVGKGKILFYDDFNWLENTNFLLYQWDFQILLQAIKENDSVQIELSIDRFIMNASSKSWPLEIVHSQIVLFFLELASIVNNAGGDVCDLFDIDLILRKTYMNKSLYELKLFIQKNCQEIGKWYEENLSINKSDKMISKIVAYIETNYNQSINLKTISYDFKINPVYLGRLFKQHIGKSFTNYINEQRIQQAVHLLKNTDYSVTDICRMVGFNNINYFYQKFKKEYGVTPLEMKRTSQD